MSATKRIKLENIRLDVNAKPDEKAISRLLCVATEDILSIEVLKRAIDCRKKPKLFYVYSFAVTVHNAEQYDLANYSEHIPDKDKLFTVEPKQKVSPRPIIIGSGPAGMFCGLYLAYKGLCPLIIEQGECVEERQKTVEDFWSKGQLNVLSNVQFGEGGAGTFSDGKLNTGIGSDYIAEIKRMMVSCGAPKDIVYSSKPHIGTDRLREMVANIRKRIIELGGEYRFGTRFVGFEAAGGHVTHVSLQNTVGTTTISAEYVVTAIGHSARDTLLYMYEHGVDMRSKPFSVGMRIEHLQHSINVAQYGTGYRQYNGLPPADYSLSYHTADGTGVYTFCMCPGGVVVGGSSEYDTVNTNGMSYYDRGEDNANSAILVSLPADSFEGVFGGMHFVRELEKTAFVCGGGGYAAPIQLLGDFLQGRTSTQLGRVTPSYRPAYRFSRLDLALPSNITNAIREAIPSFERKVRGFAAPDAVLTGFETTSSSPITIIRDPQSREASIGGIYPVGEGSGHAGGIMSSAVDGLKTAVVIATRILG